MVILERSQHCLTADSTGSMQGLYLPENRFKFSCTEFLSEELFDIVPVHEGGSTCLVGNSYFKREHGG